MSARRLAAVNPRLVAQLARLFDAEATALYWEERKGGDVSAPPRYCMHPRCVGDACGLLWISVQ